MRWFTSNHFPMKKYVLLLFLFPLLSCSLFLNENDGYEEALDKWEQSKVSNYEFRYNIGCFCPLVSPAIIVVNSDSIYQILDPENRDSLFFQTGTSTFEYAGDLYPSFYHTINGMFEIVKKARKDAHKLEVTFHENLGFPESISIDYIEDAVDDEIGYSISNYRQTSLSN